MPALKLKQRHRSIISDRIKAAERVWTERWKNDSSDSDKFPTRPERNKALLAGTYWEKRGEKDIRSVNELAPALLVQHAVVTGGKTEFLLKARRSVFEPFCDAAQALLNHTWAVGDFDAACKAARWDIPTYGFGAVEVRWIFEDDFRQAPEGDPEEIGDVTLAPPLQDEPEVKRVCPSDLLIDPQCTKSDLSDARYVFRAKYRLLADIKADKRYSNTAGLSSTRMTYHGKSEQGQPIEPGVDAKADSQLIKVYDGYVRLDVDNDGRAEMIHVEWAEGSDKELLAENWDVKYAWGSPYPWEIILNWTADQDDFAPVADIDQARWLQLMHDESETQLDGKRRSGNDLLLVPAPLMEDTEFVDNIQSSKQNAVVPINPSYVGQLSFLQRPAANVEAYRSLESTADRMKEQIGTNDFQMNNTPERKMLATEVHFMSEQGGTRQNDQIEAYKLFRARVGYKVLTLLQKYTESEREYPALDDEQQASWIDALDGDIKAKQAASWHSVSLEDLRGSDGSDQLHEPGVQFMVEINAASIGTRSRSTERQEAVDLCTMAMNAIKIPDPLRPGFPMINIRPLLRRALKTYELPDINDIVAPEPSAGDKTQMLMQMAQNALQENEQLKQVLTQFQGQMQQLQAQAQQIAQERDAIGQKASQAIQAKDQQIAQYEALLNATFGPGGAPGGAAIGADLLGGQGGAR